MWIYDRVLCPWLKKQYSGKYKLANKKIWKYVKKGKDFEEADG
jgi:hypothetical protein